MTEKIEISKDTPLVTGDIVEMTFNLIGPGTWYYFRAAQLYAIESKIKEKYKDLEILSESDNDKTMTLRLRVNPPDKDPMKNVQKAGISLTGAIIGAAIIAAGLFTWLSLSKIYKIVETPAGQVALVGTGIAAGSLGIAALIFVVIMFLTKFHKKA